jgi:valyl-tRNA synthetase
METILRLIHPLAPFISEEIWQRMAPLAGIEGNTIMRQPYPAPDTDGIDQAALAEIAWVKSFIAGVRKIRSGMNIDPRKLLPVLLQGGSAADKTRMENNLGYITSVGRVESVTWLDADEPAPESSTALVDEMKLLIPLAGLIDKEAEIIRLTKELQNKTDELGRCENKLSNASFVDKAPAAVVEKEQAKAAELKNAIGSLQEQKQKIQSL